MTKLIEQAMIEIGMKTHLIQGVPEIMILISMVSWNVKKIKRLILIFNYLGYLGYYASMNCINQI